MARNPHERKREAERLVAEGAPTFRAGVARLGGRTISDLTDDKTRGHMSPLGGGTHPKASKDRKDKR
jgi:hypothetical protein